MTRGALACLFGSLLCGCFSAPCPLAPAFAGTVGVPHLGVQTSAIELPKSGDGFVRYRPKGRHHFGLPRLVAGLTSAAERVQALVPHGAPLVIGDLSAPTGGKIPGHNSHRTGRDVDLLFYVTTPAGAPLRNPGFVPIAADGLGFVPETQEFVRFDVARQWELVKSLLLDERLGIQFGFISRPLEALLIDYALARGEPDELIYRAETVLIEPADSLPHDDHLHLRIACLPEERVTGCDGGGPYWDWLPTAAVPLALERADLEQIAREDPFGDEPALATSPAGAGGGA